MTAMVMQMPSFQGRLDTSTRISMPMATPQTMISPSVTPRNSSTLTLVLPGISRIASLPHSMERSEVWGRGSPHQSLRDSFPQGKPTAAAGTGGKCLPLGGAVRARGPAAKRWARGKVADAVRQLTDEGR